MASQSFLFVMEGSVRWSLAYFLILKPGFGPCQWPLLQPLRISLVRLVDQKLHDHAVSPFAVEFAMSSMDANF